MYINYVLIIIIYMYMYMVQPTLVGWQCDQLQTGWLASPQGRVYLSTKIKCVCVCACVRVCEPHLLLLPRSILGRCTCMLMRNAEGRKKQARPYKQQRKATQHTQSIYLYVHACTMYIHVHTCTCIHLHYVCMYMYMYVIDIIYVYMCI